MKCFCFLMLFCVFNINTVKAEDISLMDSVFKSTSKQDRMKRLLFYPVNNFNDASDIKSSNKILSLHKLGGVIINNGRIESVKNWINQVKKERKDAPIFILNVNDLLKFPLPGLPSFPNKVQMEVISNDELLRELGKNFGDLARNTGIDILMLDPSKYDSTLRFESLDKVWIKHYLKGIQNSGIVVVFGNSTSIYSGNHRYQLKDAMASFDFAGINLSKVSQALLPINKKKRKKLKFESVIFEHASNIEERSDFFTNGNELLILPDSQSKAIDVITFLTRDYKIGNKKIKQKFKQYLNLKRNARNIQKEKVKLETLVFQLSNNLQKVLIESVVCLKNEDNILPFKNLGISHFASIAGTTDSDQIFRNYLDKYAKVAHYNFDFILKDQKKAIDILSHFDKVIFNITEDSKSQKQLLGFLKELNNKTKVVVVYAGDNSKLNSITEYNAIIWIPQKLQAYASIIPQNLFGAVSTTGQFPFNNTLNIQSIKLNKTNRIAYAYSESVGVDSQILNNIDRLVTDAISTYTMPGCQVLMIKDGAVVYDKNFGYSTYDSLLKIENFSVYDIASITKVTATVPALMFLDQEDKIHIDDRLDDHLLTYRNMDKSDITIKNLLRHQSGLRSYIPFWRKAEVDRGKAFKYKPPKNKRKSYKNDNQRINWNDSIQNWINKSTYNSLLKSDSSYGYLYSDLGFMVLQELVEEKLNQSMEDFLTQNIYAPLGMNSTSFEPLCHFPLNDIVPTEQDNYLRNELIWGNVHDRNAALLDGKSGHAGLFSNANDLSKYLQMHLQKGNYGGRKFFLPKVIEEFTTKKSDSKRRALGWDKPNRKVGNASIYASEGSYGHTGFTGTMVWVDPKYNFIYIFLSNRVYPDSKNNKLSQNNIRTKIQDIMYESFLKSNFE